MTIGKSGIITGEIVANKVITSGNFTGVVEADMVEILPDGKIFGKVISSEFVIENKGIFEGESKIKNAQKSVVKAVKDTMTPSTKIEFKDLSIDDNLNMSNIKLEEKEEKKKIENETSSK